mmetsp:Transcript_14473/g.35878  ORF Transcript_14473/g.35878 Transcript_14473/m.35878 type:complete len:208 (+) Transcript_14473:268-891(+)
MQSASSPASVGCASSFTSREDGKTKGASACLRRCSATVARTLPSRSRLKTRAALCSAPAFCSLERTRLQSIAPMYLTHSAAAGHSGRPNRSSTSRTSSSASALCSASWGCSTHWLTTFLSMVSIALVTPALHGCAACAALACSGVAASGASTEPGVAELPRPLDLAPGLVAGNARSVSVDGGSAALLWTKKSMRAVNIWTRLPSGRT